MEEDAMKKTVIIVLAVLMVAALLAACGSRQHSLVCPSQWQRWPAQPEWGW